MRQYNGHKYTLTLSGHGTKYHQWQFVGPDGGIQFTVNFFKEGAEPSCGLEFHHARSGRNEHQIGTAPSHTPCWLIGEPCWHTGTSLYARETVWPEVQRKLETGDHEEIFKVLEFEYRQRFGRKNEE